MDSNSIEKMKKLIEEKKNKVGQNGGALRPNKSIGSQRKASKSTKKTGGLFDK